MPSEPEKPRGTFGSNSGSRSATERCPEGYHRVVIEHAGRARNELADLDDPPNRKRCVPVE
jgi:hypothetical protein